MSTMTESLATVSVTVGEQEMTFETGKLAKQADGAVVVRAGETMVLATAQGKMEGREGADFFPLTVDVEERMYAAGQDPRRVLQARGPPDRARDPHRPHDRPPDPAALAEGLQERGARGLHDAVGRPRHRARHPLHQRRLRGADGLAAALPGPGGRRPHRTGRRQLRHQPDPAGRRGGEHARPDRRRHEGRADDDRGRRRRDPRGGDPRGLRARARRDREDLRRAGRAPRKRRQAEVPRPRAHRRARVGARRPDPRAHRGRRPARGGSRRRGADRRARTGARHGLGRGGHPAPDPGPRLAGRDPREDAPRGRRGPRPRPVRGRPERADRGRAGLEGAQVGQAPAALRPDHRDASSCRSRSARRRSRARRLPSRTR